MTVVRQRSASRSRLLRVGGGILVMGVGTGAAVVLVAPALGVGVFAVGLATHVVLRPRPSAPPPIPRQSEVSAALHHELERCRRHSHPCALVRVKLASTAIVTDPAHGFRHAGGKVAADLRAALRDEDLVWIDGTDVLVLLPETDRARAAAFVDRARRVDGWMAAATIRIAVFPDDGCTATALRTATLARPVPSRRTTTSPLSFFVRSTAP